MNPIISDKNKSNVQFPGNYCQENKVCLDSKQEKKSKMKCDKNKSNVHFPGNYCQEN